MKVRGAPEYSLLEVGAVSLHFEQFSNYGGGLVTKSCLTLGNPMDCKPVRLLCPWDFPGKNTGVGCHFLSQGIVPTQGLNPRLLHWQVDS